MWPILVAVYVFHMSNAFQIRMDTLTPLIGRKFYVRCTLSFSKSEDNNLFGKQFYFGQADRCFVSGWHLCRAPNPKELSTFDCACSSKRNVNQTRVYRFFSYIDKITEQHNGLQFRCGISGKSDSQQMDVVMYTKRPNDPTYRCRGGSIIFEWEFNPPRSFIKDTFVVSRIDWYNVVAEQDTARMSTYMYSGDQFGTINEEKMSVINANNNFKKLKVESLDSVDAGIIMIRTVFDSKKMEGIQRNQRPEVILKNREHNFTDIPMGRQRRGDLAIHRSTTTSTTTSDATSTSTTTTEQTTTGRVATTEQVHYAPEEPLGTTIEDRINFVVTEPPLLEGEIKIDGTPSITGSLIVICSLEHLMFVGKPPVNVTIWNDDTILTSRPGTDMVRYSLPVATGNKYMCGLEGKALECLPENDKRRKRKEIRVSELHVQRSKTPRVDLFLVMYGIELTLCVIMMFWTVSLMLAHVKMILHQEKKRLDGAFQRLPQPIGETISKGRRFSMRRTFSAMARSSTLGTSAHSFHSDLSGSKPTSGRRESSVLDLGEYHLNIPSSTSGSKEEVG